MVEQKKAIDDNGYVYSWATNGMCEKGITRRDWLAGLAMQGIIANASNNCFKISKEVVADDAYLFADAMIKEGKK